jgi:hypothetical protein
LGIQAQKTLTVKNNKGSASVSGDVSPNEAKAKALNEAKTAALKSAGIDEHISSHEMLFTNSTSKDYSQFFSSDVQSELQGAISSYTITSEKMSCVSDKEAIYELVINAEVIKYGTKPDASFTANIEGLKGVYNNRENLIFTVKTSQDCYLTIFNITDVQAGMMFPNPYEKNTKLLKLQEVKFPQAKIDYSLGNDIKKQETNRLIYVFTKKEIPFVKADKEGNTSAESIFTWIYSITPDQRRVEYFTLTILK